MPPSGSAWRSAACSATAPPCEKPATTMRVEATPAVRSRATYSPRRAADSRMPASSARPSAVSVLMSYQARMRMPLFSVTGRTGACGKMKRMAGAAGSFSSGTIGTKSWPSAPSPCSQITLAAAGAAGASTTASADSWSRWVIGSAVFVLPAEPFAVGEPFHRRREPALAGSSQLRAGQPFDVIAPGGRRERVEDRARPGILLQRGGEIRRHPDGRLLPDDARRPDAFFVQRDRFPDEPDQHRVGGQLVRGADLAPAHAGLALREETGRVRHQPALPEAECGMLLERGHAGEHALVLEVRHAPLDRLFDLRAALVHRLADARQDRARERRSLCDIGVDGFRPAHARILKGSHPKGVASLFKKGDASYFPSTNV